MSAYAPLRDGRFVLWTPRRNLRLACYRAVAAVRAPEQRYVEQVVANIPVDGFGELVDMLLRRREGEPNLSRYAEEAYLLAFEARLKREGRKALDPALHFDVRRRGLGLRDEGKLLHVWEWLGGRFQDRALSAIPRSVRLVLGGSRHAEFDAAMEEMAVLVDDAAPWLRRKDFSESVNKDVRYDLLREWVEANGWRLQRHVERVAWFIERHKEQRLSHEPVESYADLDASMIQLARDLAARVKSNDTSLAYYTFRVLQRIAAYAVGQRVQWDARWFRGAKTNPRAIPGASGRQDDLKRILHEHLFELEKGHSGATGVCTIYNLKIPIVRGAVNENIAAAELGIELDAKKKPRRRRVVESV